MNLQYDVLHSGLSGTMSKDGNISQAVWRVRGRQRQAYSYGYDGLQRITSGTYADINDAGTVTASNRYNTSYTYADLRGNIATNHRNGLYLNGACFTQALLDNMSYSYTTGTNKISSISDAASATQGGFRATSGTMTNDGNGNMITYASKGITGILYNHLNLPVTITMTSGRTIEFVYAADGTKLRKVVKTSGVIGLVQEYVNGIEYKGTSIPATSVEAINHAEGRLFFGGPLTISAAITNQTVQYTGTNITSTSNISGTSNVTMTASEYIQFNPGFQVAQNVNLLAQISPSSIKREYTIKDHLGNTRIAYCDLNEDGVIAVPGEILQENHYDPFGYALEGPWMNHSQPDNLYQYNGKELNGDHGLGLYDYGARWYDAGVGRWTQVDPMAEKRSRVSSYNYVQNNPILRTDPTGALDGVGDPVQPSVAGILLEGAFQAISGGFNYIMRGAEALGFGEAGRSTRASVRYSEGGGVEGIDIVNGPAKGFVEETKSAIGDVLALTPLRGGAVVLAAETGAKNVAVTELQTTSRAARRDAMREAGIPTSQSLIPDRLTNSKDKVFLTRDGKSTVQNATNDASHQGQPHWEAGRTKSNSANPEGFERGGTGRSLANKPQIANPKSKVYYD